MKNILVSESLLRGIVAHLEGDAVDTAVIPVAESLLRETIAYLEVAVAAIYEPDSRAAELAKELRGLLDGHGPSD